MDRVVGVFGDGLGSQLGSIGLLDWVLGCVLGLGSCIII